MLLTLHTHIHRQLCTAEQSRAQRHRSNLHIIKKLVVLLSSPFFCPVPTSFACSILHTKQFSFLRLTACQPQQKHARKTHTKRNRKTEEEEKATGRGHTACNQKEAMPTFRLCLCKQLDIRQLNLHTQMHDESSTHTHRHAHAHRHNLT